MKFSDVFGIARGPDDDWFDPILSIDTPLFLDPFLVYAQEAGYFEGSHAAIVEFFNSVFQMVAESKGDTSSVSYQKALADLRFPEVEELCLGYTAAGTRGSGSGAEVATTIAAALWDAINAGLKEITHFEQIAILRTGVGADRISDASGHILRPRMAQYTAEVCTKHEIETQQIRYLRGYYDATDKLWKPIEAELPMNPYNGKPVLLVPYRYLRALPTINPDSFWDFCYSNENETLRNEFNYDVSRRVDKAQIVAVARRHPDFLKRYLAAAERAKPVPYDVIKDPKGSGRLVRSYQGILRSKAPQPACWFARGILADRGHYGRRVPPLRRGKWRLEVALE